VSSDIAKKPPIARTGLPPRDIAVTARTAPTQVVNSAAGRRAGDGFPPSLDRDRLARQQAVVSVAWCYR
jgi:hypothetical protein